MKQLFSFSFLQKLVTCFFSSLLPSSFAALTL